MKVRPLLVHVLVTVLLLLCGTSTADESQLREVSYYARNHAWLDFWRDWPQTKCEMETDMDVVQDLGANTVRLFVHPSVFGFPTPDSLYLGYLEEALQLLDDHDLRAHVNLFDCWWGWSDVQGSKDWIKALVEPYKNDGRIAVWELQNEVDLSQQVVRDWVQAVFPYLKMMAGGTPCTVSVGDVEWLDDIQALTSPTVPDLYSLHWYPSSQLSWTTPFASDIDRARVLIGSAELLVGEFGYDTYRVSETSQANLYRDILYYAQQKGVEHLGMWTLYDFPEGTTQCDDVTPALPAELHFGVYRLDGTPKPARDVLRDAYHGVFPSSPSPAIVLNGSFEDVNTNTLDLDNWCPWDEDWSPARWFEQDCTTARTGNCSVQVQGVSTMTVGLYHCPGLPVESGRSYGLEGYARTADLDGEAWIAFSWFDENETWLGSDWQSEPITATHALTWMLLSIGKAEPPPGAAYYQVFLQVDAANADAYVWFDDVTTLVDKGYLPLVLAQSGPGALEHTCPP